ncbi:MAG: hypothetical protein GF418_11585 [Chitinivibrionales bacterium]|nr:hypothetical protein [Chitinivibrionales bacterium]MBD3396257.1 hypothetical protein [Chitinivibrionales bacterium]
MLRCPRSRRHVPMCATAAIALIVLAACVGRPRAEKVLIYDEDRGIIFVDKEAHEARREEKARATAERIARERSRRGDIHVGRKKDPPELYFKSGLQYFKDGDYINALKNFTYARSADPKPEYLLWMGKTYRQLDQHDKMLSIMEEILKKYRESSVADDALFEIAFHYQKSDDYAMATRRYAELAEQYPFGVSYSNNQEFLEVSRTQRQYMRAEMITALKVLGYRGETPREAYEAFQKKNGLEVTGTPTAATVRAVKSQYQDKLQADAATSTQQEETRRATLVAAVAGAALALNLWILVAVRLKSRERKRHLANLQSALADLDTRML